MERLLNQIKRIIPVKIFKAFQPAYHFIMSGISALVYAWPSERLIVIGITGTTGKTSSIHIIAKMLRALGYKVGYTSTANFSDGEQDWLNDKKMTMVGRFFTQKMLSRMVKNKCQFAIVETSSEGVRQFRHRFINYDWLIFTGLYPEHIESHGNFENYKETKGKLFAHLKRCGLKYANEGLEVFRALSGFKKLDLNKIKKTIIINLDDEHAPYFLNFWAEEKIGYTAFAKKNTDWPENLQIIPYDNVTFNEKGISFKVLGKEMRLGLYGEFNAINAMNAVAITFILKKELLAIKEALAQVDSIPGRIEKIEEGQDFTVIVDYAFEPNAMAKLYDIVDNLPHENIIHVLGGTGGGRDKSRRAKLGAMAGEKAKFVVVTNEDPYDENPEEIMEQVVAGVKQTGKEEGETFFKIIDRGLAIEKAFSLAGKNDLVLITGKGCEQAICIACGRKIKWDDRVVARELLKKN